MFTSQYDPSICPQSNDYVLVLQGPRILGSGPLRRRDLPTSWPVERQVNLGTWDHEPLWGLSLAEEGPHREDSRWNEMRSLFSAWDATHIQVASFAKHILWWQAQNQYCSRCGALLIDSPKERAKQCPSCANTIYPVIAPAIIVAVQREGKLLLAHNANFPGNRHSVIAGFVEAGESIEQTVAREVREEVGLEIRNIHYVESQAWPFPNSLMLGFTAEWAGGKICVDGVEIDHAEWFDAQSLPEIPVQGSISRRLIELALA